jgi:hypothetical protein
MRRPRTHQLISRCFPLSLRSEMASKVLLLGVCLGSLCRGTESFLVRSPPQSLTSSRSTVELYSTKAATLPPPVKRQDTLKEEILSMIAVADGDENVVSNRGTVGGPLPYALIRFTRLMVNPS